MKDVSSFIKRGTVSRERKLLREEELQFGRFWGVFRGFCGGGKAARCSAGERLERALALREGFA